MRGKIWLFSKALFWRLCTKMTNFTAIHVQRHFTSLPPKWDSMGKILYRQKTDPLNFRRCDKTSVSERTRRWFWSVFWETVYLFPKRVPKKVHFFALSFFEFLALFFENFSKFLIDQWSTIFEIFGKIRTAKVENLVIFWPKIFWRKIQSLGFFENCIFVQSDESAH